MPELEQIRATLARLPEPVALLESLFARAKGYDPRRCFETTAGQVRVMAARRSADS